MPRTATLAEMRTAARRAADQEGATDRFPDSEVDTYINDGIAALWDLFIAVRGWPWCGKTWLEAGDVTQDGSGPLFTVTGEPVSDYPIVVQITTSGALGVAVFKWSLNGGSTYTTGVLTAATVTLGNTGLVLNFPVGVYTLDTVYTFQTTGVPTIRNQQMYELPDDFYKLYSVIATTGGAAPYPVEELGRLDESYWRDTNAVPLGNPMYYQIQSPRFGNPVAGLRLFPIPDGSQTLRVNYFPCAPTLTEDGDVFDGINGWEGYVEDYAARQMAVKDEALELVATFDASIKSLEKRIRGLVATRTTDPPRIQNARRSAGVRKFPYWRM